MVYPKQCFKLHTVQLISQNYHSLSINAVNKHKINTKEKGDKVELDFCVTPEVLKEEYLDVYAGIQSEVVSTTRFDENLDLSTMYLGRSDRAKCGKLKAEEAFPMSDQGSHYICCKSLHSLPKFASKTQRIQVGNGQYVSVLFIITVIIDVHRHRLLFQIFE